MWLYQLGGDLKLPQLYISPILTDHEVDNKGKRNQREDARWNDVSDYFSQKEGRHTIESVSILMPGNKR